MIKKEKLMFLKLFFIIRNTQSVPFGSNIGAKEVLAQL